MNYVLAILGVSSKNVAESERWEMSDFSMEMLVADLMLRITAMEKLLLDKNLISKEELMSLTEDMAKQVSKTIMEKAQSIDEALASIDLTAEEKLVIHNE